MDITQERVEPAKSIEEQVRKIAGHACLTVHYIYEDEVSLYDDDEQFWITATHVIHGDIEQTLSEYITSGGVYNLSFPAIAALLKPIKDSQPDQDWYAKYLEIKQHYEDLKTNYQRLDETYTQAIQRVKELEEQLQGCVSQEDYEKQSEHWSSAFHETCQERNEAQKQRDQYKQWFETEYAKNAEAGR
jgi:hypothetical protein